MTVRQIDDETKNWLRQRATGSGRSVEGEVRDILSRERDRDDPVNYPPGMAPRSDEGIGSYLYRISRSGIEIEPILREPVVLRDPFDDHR